MIAIGDKAANRWHLQMAERWVVQYNFYINDRDWGRINPPPLSPPERIAEILERLFLEDARLTSKLLQELGRCTTKELAKLFGCKDASPARGVMTTPLDQAPGEWPRDESIRVERRSGATPDRAAAVGPQRLSPSPKLWGSDRCLTGCRRSAKASKKRLT
jgi:hypothetical protein